MALTSIAAILAAPAVPTGSIVATGQTVGIVYHARFEDVGLYGVGFFDTVSKNLAIAAKALALFQQAKDRHITAKIIVENEGATGEYVPADAEVQWAKMKPTGFNGQLDEEGTGAYFSLTFEAIENPVFPWIFVILLVGLVSTVLVADDFAHPDLTFNAPVEFSQGFHKLADALTNPDGPLMEFAAGFKIFAVAALVVGGLYLVTRR
jgi:hypothetical protein